MTEFDTPWEGRAFALAVALHEAEIVEWEELRARMSDDKGWHDALERLLVESGVVGADEIAPAADAIAHERAHDHDH